MGASSESGRWTLFVALDQEQAMGECLYNCEIYLYRCQKIFKTFDLKILKIFQTVFLNKSN